MKKSLQTLAICLSLALIPGLTQAQRYLTETFSSVDVTYNVKYGENISIFPPPTPALIDLVMDVYEPTGDVLAQRPLIIFMHTGSFLPKYINGTPSGSRNDSATVEMCIQFAKRGYVVANMDYRIGWNPAGSNVDIRRGTILNAIYRGLQDAKACVRFFRADAATNDLFGIDPDKIILGGQGTGGYIVVNYISLDKPSEISLPKFISGVTDPIYGFVAGQPYVNQAFQGDFDGYGGIPQLNNPNNSVGYSNEIQFGFNLGGALGDSSWLEPGDAPTAGLHVIGDPFAPYDVGIVFVPGNPPQSVVDVVGSKTIVRLANQYGNNDCFANGTYTDPYSAAANALNDGYEGLFPFATLPPVQAGVWEWYDSTTVVNEAALVGQNGTTIYSNALLTNPDMSKAKGMAYIDTIMNYLNPRIVACLGLWDPTGINENTNHNISISPNPVNDKIIIDFTKSDQPVQAIRVYDVSGRMVHEEAITEMKIYNINRKALVSGTYFVRVEMKSGTVNKKIILQ